MATTGVGIVVQPLWVCHRGAGAHAQKGAAAASVATAGPQ